MTDSEVSAMTERDILIRIANDSEHTKKSVDKLWKKNDELGSTMSEVRTTQKSQGKTLETMSEAVFTGPDALSPRVRVLEQKKSGSSGQHKISIPPMPQVAPGNVKLILKTMSAIIMALIAIIAGVVTTGH